MNPCRTALRLTLGLTLALTPLWTPGMAWAEDPAPPAATATPAAAAEPKGLLAVRAAAHLPTLIMMKRCIDLSSMDADDKVKVLAILDPLRVAQGKRVDDAKAHPDDAEHDAAEARAAFTEGEQQLGAAIPVAERPALKESERLVLGEGTIFSATWPLADRPDPLPDLVKSVGLDDAQQAAATALRTRVAAEAAALAEEQAAAAAGGTAAPDVESYFIDAKRALGTAAADQFRASLTEVQRAKWDDQIRATFPAKPQ